MHTNNIAFFNYLSNIVFGLLLFFLIFLVNNGLSKTFISLIFRKIIKNM